MIGADAAITGERAVLSENISDFLLWIAFAAMTGAVIATIVRPLGRKQAPAGQDASELALYRDQLAEIGRDLERGVIEPAEAEAARLEVSRRLIAAADNAEAAKSATQAAQTAASRMRKFVALAIVLTVPALALGLYLRGGSPGMPDQPFLARISKPAGELPLEALVLRVEQHLKQNPADARGWEVLAPTYLRLGRHADAADAWGRVIALDGETAERLAAMGEAEVLAAGGLVTPASRKAFDRAAELDPHEPRAQYYLGVAEIEEGRKEAAAARWKALLAGAPEDAPWRPGVEAELARLEGRAAPQPGPGAADVEAAARLSPEERQAMIGGMVAKLAARLDENPDDLEGWLRLVRAYGVLGQRKEAEAALGRARAAFADDKPALARLDAAEKDLPAR